PELSTLSLHDALPIWTGTLGGAGAGGRTCPPSRVGASTFGRAEACTGAVGRRGANDHRVPSAASARAAAARAKRGARRRRIGTTDRKSTRLNSSHLGI